MVVGEQQPQREESDKEVGPLKGYYRDITESGTLRDASNPGPPHNTLNDFGVNNSISR
jgi:hypothetical protein